MNRKNITVAIDGYSSCGKSTLAKALAKQLNFVYVDSGAMYRAVALYLIRKSILLHDVSAVEEALSLIHLNFDRCNGENVMMLNGENVSEQIREMYVSEKVSEVAAIKQVRQRMVAQQQLLGESTDIVMDGRDIGSVVFPQAQVKLFMTAQPDIRAQRRYNELQAKGNTTISLEEVKANLSHRDLIDTTREESPLLQASDAIVLDNSFLTPEEQLNFAIERIRKYL